MRQFDLEIRVVPGFENLTADWMSRAIPDAAAEDELIDSISVPVFIAKNDSRNLVASPHISSTEEFIEGYSLMTPAELADSTLESNGLRFALRSGQLFVPTSLRADIIY